jgi:hypothetical protein
MNAKASPLPEGIWQYAGENLRRLKSSGIYYVFAKHGGKQISRSLKTKDKATATRLRNDFLNDLASLSSDEAAKLTFDQVAARWTDADKFALKASTIARRALCVKTITPFFSGLQIRHITPQHCESWLLARRNDVLGENDYHRIGNHALCFPLRNGAGFDSS